MTMPRPEQEAGQSRARSLEDKPRVQQDPGRKEIVPGENIGNRNLDGNELHGLGVPLKNRRAGRPTTSRDRAPYRPLGGVSKEDTFLHYLLMQRTQSNNPSSSWRCSEIDQEGRKMHKVCCGWPPEEHIQQTG